MPDIDPAALSRSDSITIANPSVLSLKQANAPSALPSLKTSKTANTTQRIDLEPLYTNLKIAIGDNWTKYKDAIGLYILGAFADGIFHRSQASDHQEADMDIFQATSTKASYPSK